MMKAAWPRAVVFDLDGTLVDSVADVAAALSPVMREAGLDPLSEAEVRSLMGHGAPGLLRGALGLRAGDPGNGRRDDLCSAPRPLCRGAPWRSTPPPILGAVDAVAALALAAGIAVGICTNARQRP